jgi:predicted  nucleic acid-binding Zn-ribbon protein
MTPHITLLAKLAAVDTRLDELHDELGDLPEEVKTLEDLVKGKTLAVQGTEEKLQEVRHLRGNADQTKAQIGDKEV